MHLHLLGTGPDSGALPKRDKSKSFNDEKPRANLPAVRRKIADRQIRLRRGRVAITSQTACPEATRLTFPESKHPWCYMMRKDPRRSFPLYLRRPTFR